MGVRSAWHAAVLAVLLAGAAQAADPMRAAAFRVCADPDSLPFSNRAGEGYENRIAAILAKALGRPLEYAWYPYGIGFVRQTLLRDRCDVVLAAVRPHEGIALTRPYMRAGYGLVAPAGRVPPDLGWIDDPRIAGLTVGVVTGSPPATHMARAGRIAGPRPYRPVLDRPQGAPVAQMLADLQSGQTDAVILWWPNAVWAARGSGGRLTAAPLGEAGGPPPMTHVVSVAVRREDREWLTLMNRLLEGNAEAIARVLEEFGIVPVPPGGQ